MNELPSEVEYRSMDEGPIVSSTTTPRYDDYLRLQEDIGHFSYVVLGCVGLVFCIVGVICNVLCMPVFLTHNIRSSATKYMLAITIFDTLTLLCGTSILVTNALWPRQIDQVQAYKTVTGYLVPYVQPLMEFTEMTSVYLCAALLIERYKYIKHGIYVRVLCTKTLTNQVIVLLTLFCFLYNLPKALEFRVEVVQGISNFNQANGQSNDAAGAQINGSTTLRTKYAQVRVLRTDLGNSSTFQDVYENLLRVPLEMFLPLIVVILFGTLISHSVFSSGMHATALSAPPGDAKDEYEVMDVERQKRPTDTKQPESSSPSYASTSNETEEWREQMNTVVATGIALIVSCYKFPEFIQYMLVSERVRFGIHTSTLLHFGAIVNLLGLINASLKVIPYFVCGAHLREAAKTLFCICCSRLSKPFGGHSHDSALVRSVRLPPSMDDENVPMIVYSTAADTPVSTVPTTTPTQPNATTEFSEH